ncbi:hypothetical protein F2Q68_00029343 [Brassica cretica]|uniref:Uncharacterized protein n=1 Tax=Brassica cretica TaxID=69181 RepID=A0A8S9GB55_BRACR|nr:hypothetical protein F2Q68_00029343 [Brassica cretica]
MLVNFINPYCFCCCCLILSGSIPMVGEVMSAARGATNAFSGATHHVNDALRKLGARNIKAGVGCGVGFGHGFGVGIAVKPSAIHKLQASIMGTASSLMTKLGRMSETTTDQTEIEDQAPQSLTEHKKHLDTKSSYNNNGSPTNSRTFGTRTEKVINSFLDNPILTQQHDTTGEERQVTHLESESLMLQMVLKHQKLVNELMEENETLRRIIIEDLKVSPEKLNSVSSYVNNQTCQQQPSTKSPNDQHIENSLPPQSRKKPCQKRTQSRTSRTSPVNNSSHSGKSPRVPLQRLMRSKIRRDCGCDECIRKLGARNIKAGVGCGVGFGHGFGVGIAVKPSAIHKLQASIMGTASSLMTKLGRTSETTADQTEIEDQAPQSLTEHKKHLDTKSSYKNNGSPIDSRTFGTRTEKVINSFLDNPILTQQTGEERQVTQLESESLMLQMVLKHQKLVNELMEENEKLRRIIIEDLKVSPEKLNSVSSYVYESPCKDCFECRRKHRRNR